jgi:putative ABC transport system permease protein
MPPPGQDPKGDWQVATDGSFEALGERLVSGRWFTSGDRADSQLVAVVNETMAQRYWSDGNPLGRRIRLGGPNNDRPWVTVVGVVGDLQHNGLESMVKEKFYVPHSQFAQSTGFTPRYMTLVVRTAGDPMSLVSSVKEQVRQIDPTLPIAAVRPMTDVVASAASMPRFTSALLSIFSGLALCLAAIGIYGVLAYLVSQRTREIGIRMAIGARPSSVMGLIVGRGLALSLGGVLLGLLAAAGATRLMTGLLFHVQPLDVVTFLAAPAVLVGVSVLSSAIPAWRAMRVDPIAALRTE